MGLNDFGGFDKKTRPNLIRVWKKSGEAIPGSKNIYVFALQYFTARQIACVYLGIGYDEVDGELAVRPEAGSVLAERDLRPTSAGGLRVYDVIHDISIEEAGQGIGLKERELVQEEIVVAAGVDEEGPFEVRASIPSTWEDIGTVVAARTCKRCGKDYDAHTLETFPPKHEGCEGFEAQGELP